MVGGGLSHWELDEKIFSILTAININFFWSFSKIGICVFEKQEICIKTTTTVVL